jgi:hypothetical protein
MRRFNQPGYDFTESKDYEDCQDEDCDLYMVTLAAGAHANLTDEQIQSYAVTRRRTRRRDHEKRYA